MKIKELQKLLFGIGLACAFGTTVPAQTNVPGTFKHITIDGSFADWSGVPVAYTAVDGSSTAIEYENIYLANDQTNLYIRFTLYAPRANAFANSYDNIFIDTDNNPGTGFSVGGIGSEMLVQWGGGYQESAGNFTLPGVNSVNNLGWNLASSPDYLDFELSISLGSTFASDGSAVFTNSTLALLLEGDNTSYANTEFAPPSGGLVYTFASASSGVATNTPVITLATSPWEFNEAGTDLGTNWLGASYDDTVTGWSSGDGLFGYTPSSGSYPTIHSALAGGPETFYFRTHFQWTNDPGNIAFVATNYLSDGAVYYLNGTEVKRLRMPAGAVAYSTVAVATNSPLGHADVFGINGGVLVQGDNILEVETHQAAGSSADMVFGLSLTADVNFALLNVETNLPADQVVLAGQPVTFTSDIIGSGPITYQWYFNGTNPITGANAATYTLSSILNSNAGTYTLKASNQYNVVTSRTALLTVSNVPVTITSQPTNEAVVEGHPFTLAVAVTGTPIISYQWYFNGGSVLNETNATFSITSAVFADTGAFQVVISNPVNTVTSAVANLTVVADVIPPVPTNITAGATQVTITFSKPLDSVTSAQSSKYSIPGFTVTSAVQNPANSAQVTLTVTPGLALGTVYTLTANGVQDLYGNATRTVGKFTRDITIDGSFDDWTGIAPLYSTSGPSGNTGAADFKNIYVYNDGGYYYFRVTLWGDIDSGFGQFPYYVNMFFDTDNNSGTGYSAIGSEMLVQSGYSYPEKNGTFNDGGSINGLNWLSLPVSPGTNFEFRMSLGATFADSTLVFTTNQLNFLFQGMTPGFVVENTAPSAGGVISYTNINPPVVATLPLGKIGITALPGRQAALTWDPPGTLQMSLTLAPGSWTNLPNATSPYVVSAATGKKFFRLVH